MKQYPFNTAYTQTKDLYGVAITGDEFETIGLIAWGRIGNKRYKLYRFQEIPQQSGNGEWCINLPCNCDILEAVTADYEDYQRTTNDNNSPNATNSWVEDYIENRKGDTNSLYLPGKFIKYRQEGNILYLSNKYNNVNVLYKGVVADETGLPFLNEKELDAISAFVAYSDTFKNALVNRDTNSMQLAMVLETKWKRLCNQARVPEYINQNEMDEILNVSASWDRKRFGKSYKPIR